LVRDTTFRKESIAARIEDGYLDATTLMEFFVKQGVPLRSAHEAVGKLIRQCEERKCRLVDLPAEAYDSIKPGLSEEVGKVLGVKNALAAFQSYGSTAPTHVQKQLDVWRKRLGL
jgi:argininosuccinate lyase